MIVYRKIEGLPATPIRSPYTPSASVRSLPVDNTPTKATLSTIAPAATQSAPIVEVPTSVSATATSGETSSTRKEQAQSTPKSVRIEPPASTPESRKHALPKSSLSISVTAEDVSTASAEEEVDVPLQAPVGVIKIAEKESPQAESKKVRKKDKKRKRDDDAGNKTVAAEGPTTDTPKASKKQKKDVDTTADTTIDPDGMSAAQRRAQKRREDRTKKRRDALEASRKAARLEQGDKDALKVAEALPEQTESDSLDVSQSGQGKGRALSRKERKGRQSEARLAVERSLTEASESVPSEDVNMEDSAAADGPVIIAPAVDAPAKTTSVNEEITDTPMTAAEEEPVVSFEVSTTTVAPPDDAAYSSTPTAESEAIALLPIAEASSATVPASKPKEKSKRKKEKQTVVGTAEAVQPVNAAAQASSPPLYTDMDASQSVGEQPETASPSDTPIEKAAPAMEIPTPSDTQETKSKNRAARRKSVKANQGAVESVAGTSTQEGILQASPAETAAPSLPAEPSPAVTAVKSQPTKAKTKNSKRQSAALAALAEWRAQQSKGTAGSSDTSQAASSSAVSGAAISQSTDEPKENSFKVKLKEKAPEAEIEGKSPEPEPAVQTAPAAKGVTSPSQEPDVKESAEPVAGASDSDKTPPASSAQLPLPLPSQQIARLPSSSPESYPSDSEESQDAWQKAHKRMRSPGSEDLEPEGDDDDDDVEDEGDNVGRRTADEVEDIDGSTQDRASPEAIATFTQPVSVPVPMEVDCAAEDDQIESRSSTPSAPSSPILRPPSSMSPVVYTIPVPSTQRRIDETVMEEDELADATPEATPRAESPNMYTITQDPIATPTLSHSAPIALTLTDLAAPTSPQMPSTGIAAFHDAMEEDAAADQAAMEKLNADNNTANEEASSADATQPDDASQSATDSATSLPISSHRQNTPGSPRRLRSRMKLRDGSQPELEPVKPLPLPSATPKRRGRPPKALSQVEAPVEKVCLVSRH